MAFLLNNGFTEADLSNENKPVKLSPNLPLTHYSLERAGRYLTYRTLLSQLLLLESKRLRPREPVSDLSRGQEPHTSRSPARIKFPCHSLQDCFQHTTPLSTHGHLNPMHTNFISARLKSLTVRMYLFLVISGPQAWTPSTELRHLEGMLKRLLINSHFTPY